MQLVQSQRIRLSEIVSDVYPFEEWEEAFNPGKQSQPSQKSFFSQRNRAVILRPMAERR